MTSPIDLVVTTDWLAEHHGADGLVVVDVRPADRYAAGHIPGARHLDLYPMKILDSDRGLIDAWVSRIESAFRQIGIDHDDRVVFYEEFSGTTAARGVWLMHALSLGEGAMLDGGLMAWVGAGHPIDIEPVSVEPSTINATLDPAFFATADDILCALDAAETATIIDTRADIEWSQGTIPTARHLEWIHHLEPDGTLKPVEELRGLYQQLGVLPECDTITFCASGYRAAHTWLVLRLLGHETVRNYAPSWGEWSRRGDLPVEQTR